MFITRRGFQRGVLRSKAITSHTTSTKPKAQEAFGLIGAKFEIDLHDNISQTIENKFQKPIIPP